MIRTSPRSLALSALAAATLFVSSALLAHATDLITTIAGGGSLDGTRADQANLALGVSQGLAISKLGELFFSDTNHHQVLKVNPATALVTVVAGNGAQAYTGDGFPATAASLNSPGALTFDAAGNLLIVDRGNFAIRRVDALSGIITTIAGSGLFTGQVVGANPPALLGDGGLATSATFGIVGDLTVDSTGAVIVCDSGNSCVRKFTVGGNIATITGVPGSSGFTGDTVIGGALSAKFSAPTGVVIDATGVIYIADGGNRRVRKLALDNTVTTVVGAGTGGNTGFSGDGGDATVAQIGSLGGLAFDAAGNLLISCVGANRVRKVSLTAGTPIIVTVAGDGGADVLGDQGPATGASFTAPRDLAVDTLGNFYVLDAGHQRIRRVDHTTGFIDTVVGTGLAGFIGDRGPWQSGILSGPAGAVFDSAGNLYIAEVTTNAVRRIAPDGKITTFAGDGTASGSGDGGPAALASLSGPRDVCVFGSTLFIADTGNNHIRAVDLPTGLIRTFAIVPNPVAIVANSGGILYVAHDDQVDTVDLAGTVATFAGNNPMDTVAHPLGDGLTAPNATLSAPSGLALTAAGDLFIADTGNNLIREIANSTGIVSTVAGSVSATALGDGGAATAASLSAPRSVATDGTHILIADTGHHRIRSVDNSITPIITTICGNGTPGLTGDGDLAISAAVNSPGRIFFNGANLIIADTGNQRIRQLVSALDMDLKALSFSAKLNFTVDKKTGQLPRGKDSVSVKTALALPAGISSANLPIHVDIIDLHQQTQFTALGKPPIAPKPTAADSTPFGFNLPTPPLLQTSKFVFTLKGPSIANSKPVAFSFTSIGTLRAELARAGYSDITTPPLGTSLPVRVNITLGSTTFTGVAATTYKATQGKTASAVTIKPK